MRLVQRLAKRSSLVACPACGRQVSRQALACPQCGRLITKRFGRWLSKAEWQTIAIALIVFVGVPAAVIFFLVVVCAPHGR
jgi:predicted amidophosphoribosyltransferase